MMKRSLGLFALAALVAGCGGNNDANSNYLPMNRRNVTPEAVDRATKSLTVGKGAKIAAGTTDFGFKLFGKLAGKDVQENLFVSPASVSTVLAMVYNGAGTGTKDAFESALGTKGFTTSEVNSAYKELRTILMSPDPKVEVNFANAIWAQRGAEFKRDFLGRNTDYFGAKISEIDLKHPDAVKEINDWVKTETEEKIPKLFEKLGDEPRMILVNAIYFKGAWTEPFKKERTADGDFTGFDGKKVQTKMMSRNGDYDYLKEGKFTAARLPYGDGRVSMTLLLPDAKSSVNDVIKDLNSKNWSTWQGKFKPQNGLLVIPKFKVESDKNLNQTLSDLGLQVAFDPNKADFSGMSDKEKLFITQVVHKTFVDVNEEGTEAAAATGVEMGVTSAPAQNFNFVADRPFVFAISDKATGAVLFLGVFGKP